MEKLSKTPEIFVSMEDWMKETSEADLEPKEVVEQTELDETTDQLDQIEKAPTMEIQAREIRDYFIEQPELQYENWKKMDLAERVDALQALEYKVAEIAKRPPIGVQATKMSVYLNGYYRPYGNSMYLNQKYMNGDRPEDYKQIMNTFFHEGRHAYQRHNVQLEMLNNWDGMMHNGEPVSGVSSEQSRELVQSWFDNDYSYAEESFYRNGDRASDYVYSRYKNRLKEEGIDSVGKALRYIVPPSTDLGMEEYYLQPVEVDARTFAEAVINELEL